MRFLRGQPLWLVFVLLATSAVARAQPSNVLDFVRAQLPTITWGQYMEHNCGPTIVTGWEGYPTILCRYSSDYGPVPVVLLNPDPGRLSSWLVTACEDAGAQYPKHCVERLALRIKCQSGNQFPVAGFVEEGSLYTFRDGITVTFANIGTFALTRAPTAAEESLVLGDGAISKVHKYARVQGTTRSEYADFVGKPVSQFAGLAWRDEVRQAYQSAWNSEENALLSAWAARNRSLIDHKLAPAARFDDYCKSIAATWVLWPITDE